MVDHPETVSVVRPKWLALGAVVVLMGLVVRSAWVTEDAYITLRSVHNWVEGHGLRWNVDERVQGYTHPLWMLLLSAVYVLVRDPLICAVLLGVLVTFASLALLVHLARTAGHATAVLLLLLLSRSFVEFSTSGLENPLTQLLVALFVVLYVRREPDLRSLVLTASLLALSRMDAVLVTLPALVHVALGALRVRGAKQTAREVAYGASPLFAWELFSLVYYGFLVPNTAFAKLHTGIPRGELLLQGVTYLLNAVAWDLPLVLAIVLGLAATFLQTGVRERLLASGVLLYLVYVVWIGGDFMLGRFLTLPLFLSICLLAVSRLPLEEPARLAIVLLPFAVLFFHPDATEKYPVGDIRHSGVADERLYFREHTSLMMFTRTRVLPNHPWGADGDAARLRGERVVKHENIGFFGFAAGPGVHVVDQNALTDPLLARLPARLNPEWRVGHYTRAIVPGYFETLQTGTCQMPDKNLCAYYDKLRIIVAGKLFSLERFATIFGMMFGAYDALVDRDRYRYPDTLQLKLADVSAEVAEGAGWNVPGMRVVGMEGASIDLGQVSHAKAVSVTLDFNDSYWVDLRRGTESLELLMAPMTLLPGVRTRVIAVPEHVQRTGFDRVVIRPKLGDAHYSLGFVRLVP